MARYLAENHIPAGVAGHEFIGWDDLDELSTEATRAEHLGISVPEVMAEMFNGLAPGQRIKTKTGSLFREW